MSVDQAEFRRILGHWTTGVAIVATTSHGLPRGLTATAVTSVSLDPPLVLACIGRGADTHDAIRRAGFFSISVLPQEEERIARRFAGDDDDKFDGIAHHEETTGAPVLDAALAWLDCAVHELVPAGDHTIVIGRVVAGDARGGEPLVYFRGGYARLVP